MLLFPDQNNSSGRTAFFVLSGIIHVGLFVLVASHSQDLMEMLDKGTDSDVTIEIDASWGEQTELADSAENDSAASLEVTPQEGDSPIEQKVEPVIAKATPPPPSPPLPQKMAAPKKTAPPAPKASVTKSAPEKRVFTPAEEPVLPDSSLGSELVDESSRNRPFEPTPQPQFQSTSEKLNEPDIEDEFERERERFEDEISRENQRLEEERQNRMAALSRNSDGIGSGQEASTTQTFGAPQGVRDYRSLAQQAGNISPAYDTDDRLKRREGTVRFLAYVNKDGSLADFRMKQSSGHQSLDQKSLQAVRNWRFVPGQEGWVEIPIVWTLRGEPEEYVPALRTGISQN